MKLTDENHIVLLDFGLSKDSSGSTIASKPGSSGSVVGYTPHFASMEQIRGTGTNSRSDIYSLSATLYQLMTHTIPSDALTRADAMLSGSADPIIPLSNVNPDISPAVSNVILKGLEVSMDRRFATAAEMQKALRTAHSQMQDQMSADTQVFTVGNLHATVPPKVDPTIPVAPSEMATRTPTINPEPTAEPVASPNLDATIQMSADQSRSEVKQANVETEVFLAGSIPEAGRADSTESGSPSPFDATQMSVLPGIEPQRAAEPAPPEFFTAPAIDVKAEAPPAPRAVSVAATTSTPAKAPLKQQQKSGSKAFVILGGLAAIFILALGAMGAGWYYYTNYYAVATVRPTPSPSASPIPDVTPSPELTPPANASATDNRNSALNLNSNVNTNSTNVNTADVEPAPAPRQGAETRPTAVPRDTTKPAKTPPAPKATPKPKPQNDRTILIQ